MMRAERTYREGVEFSKWCHFVVSWLLWKRDVCRLKWELELPFCVNFSNFVALTSR